MRLVGLLLTASLLPAPAVAGNIKLESSTLDDGSTVVLSCESAKGWAGNRCELSSRSDLVAGKSPSRMVLTELSDEQTYLVGLLRDAARKALSQPADSTLNTVPNRERQLLADTRIGDASCWPAEGAADLLVLCSGPTSRHAVLFVRGLCDRCEFRPFILTGAAVGEQGSTPVAAARQAMPGAALLDGELRTDGVYVSDEPPQSSSTMYVRFFANGQVLNATTNESLQAVCRRYREPVRIYAAGVGPFTRDGASLAYKVTYENGVTLDFAGSINAEQLHISWTNRFNGTRPTRVLRFFSCPAAAN